MTSLTTEQIASDLRRAYLRRNESEINELSKLMTAVVAKRLADQRPGELDRVVKSLGPVIEAADTRGTERPGMQWRRLSQIAAMLRDYPQQLEVQRWLDPRSVHGQLLRLIQRRPGITVSALAVEAGGREINHVSNALSRLETAGYITRTADGRLRHLFLSPIAKKKLEIYENAHTSQILEDVVTAIEATPAEVVADVREPGIRHLIGLDSDRGQSVRRKQIHATLARSQREVSDLTLAGRMRTGVNAYRKIRRDAALYSTKARPEVVGICDWARRYCLHNVPKTSTASIGHNPATHLNPNELEALAPTYLSMVSLNDEPLYSVTRRALAVAGGDRDLSLGT